MKPRSIDFELSAKARLFRGAKRLGLIVRDRNCQGPGCGTAARYCQGDHIKPYRQGGPTIPSNGEMLCGPCHRWKTWPLLDSRDAGPRGSRLDWLRDWRRPESGHR